MSVSSDRKKYLKDLTERHDAMVACAIDPSLPEEERNHARRRQGDYASQIRDLQKITPVTKVTKENHEYDNPVTSLWLMDVASVQLNLPNRAAVERKLYEYNTVQRQKRDSINRIVTKRNQDRGVEFRDDFGPVGAFTNGDDGTSFRDLSTATGNAGEFLPPGWLSQNWVAYARGAQSYSGYLDCEDLPDGISSVNTAAITGSLNAQTQQAENQQPAPGVTATSLVESPVLMYVSSTAMSLQLVERSTTWQGAAVRDAAEGITLQREIDALVGSGAAGPTQGTGVPLGMVNVSGIGVQTYTASPGVVGGLLGNLAASAQTVAKARHRNPEVFLMSGDRWFDIAGAQSADTLEPVMKPGLGYKPVGLLTPSSLLGPLFGVPVITPDSGMFSAASGAQDFAVACRPSDIMCWAGKPTFSFQLEGGAANQLSVYFVVYQFVSIQTGRYPGSICVSSGSGWGAV